MVETAGSLEARATFAGGRVKAVAKTRDPDPPTALKKAGTLSDLVPERGCVYSVQDRLFKPSRRVKRHLAGRGRVHPR